MASPTTTNTTAPSHYNDWPNALGFDTTYEEHEPIELKIQGHIPAYAAGILFRTGVGPRTVTPDQSDSKNGASVFKSDHWFDGFAQVHRFELWPATQPLSVSSSSVPGIGGGTYTSRLTSDGLINRVRREGGKMNGFSFARKYEPCRSFFQKVQSVFNPKQPNFLPNEVNNAVTLSINYPGFSKKGEAHKAPLDTTTPANGIATLCNKTDAARFQHLDPDTLEPLGLASQSTLHPDLKGVLSGAHAKSCPVTGDVFNYNMDFTGRNATYRVFRTRASTGETSILATVLHAPSYLHSLFMSEHYIILCVWNSHYTKYGASILWENNLLDAMYFNNKAPAAWYVIDRRCPQTEGGQGLVAKFESEPFFAFHSINAFEVPSEPSSNEGAVDILLDIPIYANTDVIHRLYMDNLISSNQSAKDFATALREGRYEEVQPRLRRYRLSRVPDLSSTSSLSSSKPKPASVRTATATVEFTATPSASMELPTLNFNYITRPYRYIYGVRFIDGHRSTFLDGLIKHDLNTGEVTVWSQHGQTPGEAIFVPNPQGTAEDDGILLTVVLDGHKGASYLMCLDARNMTELGRAYVNGVVGFGFHGLFTKSTSARSGSTTSEESGSNASASDDSVGAVHF